MAGRVWVIALFLALAAWYGPAGAQDGKAVHNISDDQELKELSSKTFQLFNKEGKYKEATGVLLTVFTIAEGRYGPDHSIVAQAHSALAHVYVLQDQPEEAARHQLRAIAIFERPLAALTRRG